MNNIFRVVILGITVSLLSACMAVATTTAGIGGSAALNHTMRGVSYRTFTASAATVNNASIKALKHMRIEVISKGLKEDEDVYLITAKADKRNIEVEIEPISANAARISVSAKKSFFQYDSATADEIVKQTNQQLAPSQRKSIASR
jgi:hypothetical protein